LQVGCHKKVVNFTHAHLIAIQNQWDLTRMRKDRLTICNDAAKLLAPQKEICTSDYYFLPYQSKNASSPPWLVAP
jgi:hypothetical protein